MRTLVRWPIGLRREGAKPPSKNLRINSMYDGRTVKESTILLTMQPEIFYWVRQAGHVVFIDGYFYYGGFYRRHQLIGRIEEDGTFVYVKGHGQSTFPKHIAGHAKGWC